MNNISYTDVDYIKQQWDKLILFASVTLFLTQPKSDTPKINISPPSSTDTEKKETHIFSPSVP
jgi:hypothetical protein